jgi:CheY-like chemotaxis protein
MTTILCINDEIGALTILRLILERSGCGYEVLTTTTSREALTILASQPIDLVIQDFMRLEMDGFEFLKHMKSDESLRDIPVLAATAGSREFRSEQLKQVGLDIDRDLDGFVNMPLWHNELLDRVQAILSKRSDDTEA